MVAFTGRRVRITFGDGPVLSTAPLDDDQPVGACVDGGRGAAVSVRKTQPFLLVLRTSVYSFRPFSEPAACWLQSKPLSSDGYSSCVYRLVAQRPINRSSSARMPPALPHGPPCARVRRPWCPGPHTSKDISVPSLPRLTLCGPPN